jgi:hypothetical protein
MEISLLPAMPAMHMLRSLFGVAKQRVPAIRQLSELWVDGQGVVLCDQAIALDEPQGKGGGQP